jgi:hypothetical protein
MIQVAGELLRLQDSLLGFLGESIEILGDLPYE